MAMPNEMTDAEILAALRAGGAGNGVGIHVQKVARDMAAQDLGRGRYFRCCALKRLAFAYHKLGQPAQAIAAYEQCERLTPLNAEEHDWLLCLYYLADWPRHQQKFGERLRKMTGNPNHGYHDKALNLKQKLQAAGWQGGRVAETPGLFYGEKSFLKKGLPTRRLFLVYGTLFLYYFSF